jgi:hypothetical protein
MVHVCATLALQQRSGSPAHARVQRAGAEARAKAAPQEGGVVSACVLVSDEVCFATVYSVSVR